MSEAKRKGQFGPAYIWALDGRRLNTQMERVRSYMLGVEWRTLEEIQTALERQYAPCRFPAASVSAQLRHLKKPAFGSHVLAKRRRQASGLFEYRLAPPPPLFGRDPRQSEMFPRAR
jgi:hypothetical protein